MKTTQGGKAKFAVVVARFNEVVTRELLSGALEEFKRAGVPEKNIVVHHVPGSFEIPLTALKLARTKKYSAVVCLGAVIRGETPHFEYVSSEVARGVMEAGLVSGIPCIFGVLTTENVEQAMLRAGGKGSNKGTDAAKAAMEMAHTIRDITL